jgi:predicted ArsR family transcriptional regulator
VSQLQQQARALGDPTRHEIFSLLASAPAPLGVAELAEVTGLHHNAVRQHLAKLVDAALVERHRARAAGRGRPRLLYSLAPDVGSRWGVTGPYERLAVWLGEMVRSGDAPEEVGRRVGRRFVEAPEGAPQAGQPDEDPVDRLVEGMVREGFAPERREVGGGAVEVVLMRCPFAAAASEVPEPVCRFHLGYAQGLAEGSSAVVDELVPSDPRVAGCRLRCHDGTRPRP